MSLFLLAMVPAAHAQITVNSTADNTTSGDGNCTLREAITNANNNSDGTSGDCTAGSGNDTVDLTGVSGTITLSSALPSFSSAGGTLAINGPGARDLTIDFNGNSGINVQNVASIDALTLTGATFNGALSCSGNANGMTVTNSTIDNNASSNAGGGLSSNSGCDLTVTNSTISNNSAGGTSGDGDGGGISVRTSPAFPAIVNISNTTVSNNTTTSNDLGEGGGGGLNVALDPGSSMTLTNVTISDNQALGPLSGDVRGGGIRFTGSVSPVLVNTIIANNSALDSGPDCFVQSGSINVTSGDNIIESTSGCSLSGSATTGDPGLGALADNGGPTNTQAPTSGSSSAVNTGTCTLSTDQRGFPRPEPSGSLCDIGAVEFGSSLPTPMLAIDDVSQVETNAGTTTFQFTVTLTNDATGAFSVDYATADDAATTADGDYQSASGTLNFAGNDGETQTLDVTVNGDTKVELDEAFFVNLSNVVGATVTIADSQGEGTIENDDAATLAIDDVSQVETDAGTTTFQFTTTLTGQVDTGLSLDIDTADDAATTADGDYLTGSSTLNFIGSNGETQTFNVTVNGDTKVELDETFFVNLSGLNASGRNVTIADAQGTGTIENDDAATLSINDVMQVEGDAGTSTFQFTVTLDNAVDAAVGASFTTTDGTAEDESGDGDYQSNAGTVSFTGNAGETQTIDITVNGDTDIEPDETFFVDLSSITSSGRAVSFADNQGLGTITSDDGATLAINNVSQVEGDAGTSTYQFTVTLTGDAFGTFSVDYDTADNTATTGDGDYQSASGTLNFSGNDGETQTLDVTVNGDTKVELDETFFVDLSNIQGAGTVTFADSQGEGTIENDDAATLSIDDVSQIESDAGTSTFQFTVTLDNEVDTGITLDIDTADNTATTADGDYVANTGSSLSFTGNAGETQTFDVTVNGDTKVELDESFFVDLSNIAAGGRDVTFADDQGLGTLENDDAATLSIDDVSQVEGDAGTSTFQFTVTLDNEVDTGITLDIDTADNTATTADGDYVANTGSSLSFTGNAGETQTFDVTVNGDTDIEPDESFFVDLSNIGAGGRDVTFADDQGLGTILTDDGALLAIDNVSQVEGNAGTSTFQFTVTLTGDAFGTFSIDYNTADNTATTADGDYQSTSGTLNFAGNDGETQTLDVTVNGDTKVELDESFFIDLSNIQGAGTVMFADDQGEGTLENDDAATLSIDDVTLNEGSAGTTIFQFTATLDNAVDTGLTADFATADDTAEDESGDGDYQSNAGTVSFTGNAGETQTIDITVNGDTTIEPDETFFVDLSNLSASGRNVTIADAQGLGTILDDDNDVDLAVSHTESIDPVLAGSGPGNLTYVLTLTNNGPAEATGVTLDEVFTLPAGVSVASVNVSAGTFADPTWTLSSLAAGASETLTAVLTVAPEAPAGTDLIAATATVTAVDQSDTDPGNDTNSEATSITRSVDLAVTMTESADPIEAGSGPGNLTYIVTLTNAGPSEASGIEIEETLTLPTGVMVDSVTPSAGSFTDPTWSLAALAPGASETLTIVLTASDSTPAGVDRIASEATITAVNEPDSDTSNDSARETTSVDVEADVSLVKTATTLAPDFGSDVVFTLTVSNAGPSEASEVVVREILPEGLVYVADDGGGAYNATTGRWIVGTLAMGATATLQLTVRVATAAPATNTARANTRTPDPDPSNNSASVVLTPVASDLSLEKRLAAMSQADGVVTATFELTVSNAGPSAATGVVVTEMLPAGLTLTGAEASQGTYEEATGQWAVGTLGVGATAELRITVTGDAEGEYLNTAEVTAADQPDPDSEPSDGTGDDFAGARLGRDASETDRFRADLSLTKTVDEATPSVGSRVVYTLTVTNAGPHSTAGVVVRDVLPEGVEFVSASVSDTTDTYDASTGLWQVGQVKVGSPAVLRIEVEIVGTGEIENVAEVVASHLPDPDSVFDDGDPEDDAQASAVVTVGENSASAGARSTAREGANTSDVPSRWALGSNYPNPFNPETVIPLSIPEASWVRVEVYDVLGKRVAMLLEEDLSAGVHEVVWRADSLPTGVYLVRMQAGSIVQTQRVTLMK